MGEKKLDSKKVKVLTEEMIDEKLNQLAERLLRAEAKREYMDLLELQRDFRNWSADTVRRKIQNEGFPFVDDGGGICYPRSKVREWFKKRERLGNG